MQIGLPVVQLYLIGFEAHITLLVEWALTCSLEYLKKKEPRIQYFIFEQSFVFTPATKQQSNPNYYTVGFLYSAGIFLGHSIRKRFQKLKLETKNLRQQGSIALLLHNTLKCTIAIQGLSLFVHCWWPRESVLWGSSVPQCALHKRGSPH